MSENVAPAGETVTGRLQHGVIGGIAGLSLWFCFEELPEAIDSERLLAFVSAFLMIFFTSTLLMTGPIKLIRAAAAAVALSLVGATLYLWASFRFETLDAFFQSAHSIAAFGLLSLLSLPFLVTAQLPDTRWHDYDRLFDQAWSMFVRGLIGGMFSGVFWLILVASNALLGLVGVSVIEALMDQGWFAAGFTGATFGLALGVLNEHQRIVSTVRGLALRLLRLMLPVVAVVGTIFVALLPLRGLDQVFGDLSAAGTLIGMAMVTLSLIAAGIDGTDESAAQSRLVSWSARLLCIVLPVVTGLALYALWIRVAQYGWTPARITGILCAGILCGYGAIHIASFIRGSAWRGFIRTGNTVMALAVIAVSALLQTPLLNPEGISARDQMARFESGLLEVQELPLHDFQSNWGIAGTEAWERLEAIEDHPQQALLERRMQESEIGSVSAAAAVEIDSSDLEAILPVRPEGTAVPDGFLDAIPAYYAGEIHTACETRSEYQLPNCVLVLADFVDSSEGPEAILIWAFHDNAEPRFATLSRPRLGGVQFDSYADSIGASTSTLSGADVIRDILSGEMEIRQPAFQVLDLGPVLVLPPISQE